MGMRQNSPMIARSLQILMVCLLLFWWGLGAWLWSISPLWLLWAMGLAVLTYFALTLLGFGVMHRINRHDPAPRARMGQVLRAAWGEAWAVVKVFCWWQAFRANAIADFLPATPTGQRGVVLIHGIICNRGIWTPLMRQLQAQGIPFVAVNLEPVFGSINRYIPIVQEAAERLRQHTGLAPNLVCHSMGGMAARAWMATRADDDCFHRLITIGSPHHGTALSLASPFANAQQMARSHRWHQDLLAQEKPQRLARSTCWYSHCDNIVVPASTATLPGADNRFVTGKGHVDMVFDPQLVAQTLVLLKTDVVA